MYSALITFQHGRGRWSPGRLLLAHIKPTSALPGPRGMPEQVFSPAFPAWRSFGLSPVGWPPGQGDPQPTRSHPPVPRSSAGDPLEERLGETHSEPIYDLIQKDKNPQYPQHNSEAVLHGAALPMVLTALPAPRRCTPHTALEAAPPGAACSPGSGGRSPVPVCVPLLRSAGRSARTSARQHGGRVEPTVLKIPTSLCMAVVRDVPLVSVSKFLWIRGESSENNA